MTGFWVGILFSGVVAALLLLAMHMAGDRRVCEFVASVTAAVHGRLTETGRQARASKRYRAGLKRLVAAGQKDDLAVFTTALHVAVKALKDGDEIAGGGR